MNRRRFIGKSLWAIIGFGVISPSMGLGSYRKGPVKPNRDLQRYRLDKTIFCQFDNSTLVGRQAWETYLQYCRLTGDQIPCLIIDGRDCLEFPTQRNFILISPNDTKKTVHIKNLIAGARPR